jgi:hypothetical protein
MYNYNEQKKKIFTEKGQEMFLKIRDNSKTMLSIAGCFRMTEAIKVVTGDVWDMMACVDRMVELGEIVEVEQKNCAGQHRIFVKA